MNSELQERFERFVGRSGGYRNVDIQTTDGNYLVSRDGDRYVDFVAGWNVVNVGYGRQEIIDAMQQALERAAYVKPTYVNEDVVELAETLADITPGDLSHTFRTPSGSESVEMAIQAARSYTGNTEIVVNENAYHGHTYGAMTLGSPGLGEPYKPLLPNVTKITPPSEMGEEWFDELEETLRETGAAAYITETIHTHQGVHKEPFDHYKRVQEICEETDTLLVLDEVANGFSRTGELFAADHYDVEADMMTFAKGMSSGYAPVGAMIATQDVGQHMTEEGGTYSTFGWTPDAVAATRKNIELLQEENLASRGDEMGRKLAQKVQEIEPVQDVRQFGMLIGVEFEADIANDLRKAGVANGVMTGTTNVGDVLMLSPPLNIDQEYMEQGVTRLQDAVNEVIVEA